MRTNFPSPPTASVATRRDFLRGASLAAVTALSAALPAMAAVPAEANVPDEDRARMRALAKWTALTFETANPVTYGADILNTKTGERLMRAVNAVGPEHDPSAHGELRTIRLACAKLKTPSLKGYTLYTTCEPCPMCMACCLWAGLDRVVYGATIDDASHFGGQIHVAAAEVARHADVDSKCVVDGPVEREACLALFNDPRMKKTIERWKSEK